MANKALSLSLSLSGLRDFGGIALRIEKNKKIKFEIKFFEKSGQKDTMDREALEAWLVRINGQLGRGSGVLHTKP